MSLTYVAELALPPLVPSVELSIGAPAIAISAELSGNLALNASLQLTPPTVAIYLAALADVEAAISVAIGLSLPSISFSLSDELALIASLEAALGLLVTLEGLLSASIGMYAFAYGGAASSMGASVTAELATQWPDGVPTSGNCNALIFGAVDRALIPGCTAQLEAFLNGLTYGTGLIYTAKMAALSQMSLVTNLAVGQGVTGINYLLKAALALQASVSLTPPELALSLDGLLKFAAFLRANIALGPPKLQAALNATANVAAALSAQFSLLIDLGILLSSPGLFFCYTYAGPGNALGAALTTALASTWGDGSTPTSDPCVTAILATTDSFTYGIMTGFFGGV